MSTYLVDHESQVDLFEIVERARGGDHDAFGTIYDLHQGQVFRMLVKLTRSHTLAEDLTSETFFRALRSLPSSEVRGDYMTAWLMRIARNLAVDHFKSKPNLLELPIATDDHPGLYDDVMGSPEDEVMVSLGHAALLRAVDGLPAGQRVAITARFLHDLSITETARMMDCSEGAVKQLQFRGIRKLAQTLSRDVA